MNDINAEFARIFAPGRIEPLPPRLTRQLQLEEEIVGFAPSCTEVIDMIPALLAALRLRYGDERLVEIDRMTNKLNKALEELQLEIDSGLDHNGDFVRGE